MCASSVWGSRGHKISVGVGLVICSAHYVLLFVFPSRRLFVQAVVSSSGSPGNTLQVLLSLPVVPLPASIIMKQGKTYSS